MNITGYVGEIEVFVHSHYLTGDPLNVDVFAVNGLFDMAWVDMVVSGRESRGLADYLHSKRVPLDQPCWLKVYWDFDEDGDANMELIEISGD